MLRITVAAAAVVGLVLLPPESRSDRRRAAVPTVPHEEPVTERELLDVFLDPLPRDLAEHNRSENRLDDRRPRKLRKQRRPRRSQPKVDPPSADPRPPRAGVRRGDRLQKRERPARPRRKLRRRESETRAGIFKRLRARRQERSTTHEPTAENLQTRSHALRCPSWAPQGIGHSAEIFDTTRGERRGPRIRRAPVDVDVPRSGPGVDSHSCNQVACSRPALIPAIVTRSRRSRRSGFAFL